MSSVSTIQLTKLRGFTRLDAEYYLPEYIQMYQKLVALKSMKLKDCAFITDGIHESIQYDNESGIKIISAQSVKYGYFDLSANMFISKGQHEKNKRTSLQENDVIISSVGTIGNASIVEKEILPANADRHVGIIRIKEKINPYFLVAFLNSKYGKFQTLREATGNVQLNLFIDKIKEILVPILPNQNKISKLVENSLRLLSESKIEYKLSEDLLLKELGIYNKIFDGDVTFTSKYGKVLQNNRIDAEYFQPKFDKILEIIRNYKNGHSKVEDIIHINDKNFTPKKGVQYRYIELSNIAEEGKINGFLTEIGENLPSRARRQVNQNDVIISSIEGSLSSCALITEKYNECLCSTGFFVLNSKRINSETLLTLFKSYPIQELLKRGCSGTILTAINKEEMNKLELPLIDLAIQNKIKEKIQKSYKLKDKSEKNFKEAIKIVENTIEIGI
jgi:restriction endonuclease S subunit